MTWWWQSSWDRWYPRRSCWEWRQASVHSTEINNKMKVKKKVFLSKTVFNIIYGTVYACMIRIRNNFPWPYSDLDLYNVKKKPYKPSGINLTNHRDLLWAFLGEKMIINCTTVSGKKQDIISLSEMVFSLKRWFSAENSDFRPIDSCALGISLITVHWNNSRVTSKTYYCTCLHCPCTTNISLHMGSGVHQWWNGIRCSRIVGEKLAFQKDGFFSHLFANV